jgi:hypothetical protein
VSLPHGRSLFGAGRCLLAAASLVQLLCCLLAAAGLEQAVSLPLGRSQFEAGCVVASWPQPVLRRLCRCLWPQPV